MAAIIRNRYEVWIYSIFCKQKSLTFSFLKVFSQGSSISSYLQSEASFHFVAINNSYAVKHMHGESLQDPATVEIKLTLRDEAGLTAQETGEGPAEQEEDLISVDLFWHNRELVVYAAGVGRCIAIANCATRDVYHLCYSGMTQNLMQS